MNKAELHSLIEREKIIYNERVKLNKILKKLYEESSKNKTLIEDHCIKIIVEKFKPIQLSKYNIFIRLGEIPKIEIATNFDIGIPHQYACHIGNNNFIWVNRRDRIQIYSHNIINDIPPFDPTVILKKCSELTEELCMEVKIRTTELITKLKYDVPCSLDDVKLIHPNCEILHNGQIIYLGWDCEDNYVLLKDTDGIHLYYGTTAHGGGLNKHIKPGENFSDFFLIDNGEDKIDNVEMVKQILRENNVTFTER